MNSVREMRDWDGIKRFFDRGSDLGFPFDRITYKWGLPSFRPHINVKELELESLRLVKDKYDRVVDGVNIVKKHTKPTNDNPGGINEIPAPIHISNLSLLTAKGEETRVGYRKEDGKKVRFSKKSNEVI